MAADVVDSFGNDRPASVIDIVAVPIMESASEDDPVLADHCPDDYEATMQSLSRIRRVCQSITL